MKKNRIFLLFMLLAMVSTVSAQTNTDTLIEELTMTSYDKDPEAEAFVIREQGDLSFHRYESAGFSLQMNYKIRIKILSQAGLEHAEFEIPYYVTSRNEETIERLSATTYNYENGQVVETKLNKKDVFEEKIGENWRRKKFAMPNVREGSVVEVSYAIYSPFLFNTREWKYQKTIPVKYSEFQIKVIPFYEYAYIAKGISNFDVYKENILPQEHQFDKATYKEIQYIMGMRNVPAFRDQEFITSPKDYMMSLNLELAATQNVYGVKNEIMTTWPDMCDKYLKDSDFGKYIDAAAKEGKKILPTLGIEGKSNEEIVKILTEYVKMNYNWNGVSNKIIHNKLSNVIKEKKGNSAELNLFLLGLLKQAGIDADPILMSTRSRGIIDRKYPFEIFFNYVIVRVNGGEAPLFLDATESMLYYDELPARCLNMSGLVVKKKSNEWIEITQNKPAASIKSFDIKCDPNSQTVNVAADYETFNSNAYTYRGTYYGDKQNLIDLFRKRDLDISSLEIRNYSDLSLPFGFSFETTKALETADGKLFVYPFVGQSPSDNIFKQTDRILTVDLIYKQEETYKSSIQIPAGYKVESLPKDINTNNKLMSITYKAVENNGNIEVEASYKFKQSKYEAKEYSFLKQSYNQIIKAFNEIIVLSKIEE